MHFKVRFGTYTFINIQDLAASMYLVLTGMEKIKKEWCPHPPTVNATEDREEAQQ